jgi:hypothetical protein
MIPKNFVPDMTPDLQSLEMFTLKGMTRLLSYLDPLHPFLANISNVQSLGQD